MGDCRQGRTGVSARGLELDMQCKDGEEDDLDGSAGGIPEGPRHTEAPRDVAALQQRCRPRPLRHDDRRREARLDGAACRVKLLRRHVGATIRVVDPHNKGRDE